jgi:hypothetical protein
MINPDILNLKRLYNLIMIELKSESKTIFTYSMTIILFLILTPFSESGKLGSYFFILYTGGFVLTSRIFNDMHNPQKSYLFLMLPCSNLERFLSKWILSSVGFALGTLLLCYSYSLLIAAINSFDYKHPIDLFQENLWIDIWKYIILQSVLLLGAVTFRSHALMKTTLVLGCFFLAISLFSLFVTIIFFLPGHLDQGATMIEGSLYGWNFAFWVTLAPVCWYITYLRVTEYELK